MLCPTQDTCDPSRQMPNTCVQAFPQRLELDKVRLGYIWCLLPWDCEGGTLGLGCIVQVLTLVCKLIILPYLSVFKQKDNGLSFLRSLGGLVNIAPTGRIQKPLALVSARSG